MVVLNPEYEEEECGMQKTIRLKSADDVRAFVKAASKCDFDIDIFYNRVTIDAKSLLGVFSLDLTRDLTVSCMGYDPVFDSTLKKYAVAS